MSRLAAIGLAVALIRLTGPDGQIIDINTNQIVTVREPRGKEQGHFHEDVHCLIHTTDGKVVAVVEACEKVRSMLREFDQE